MAKEPSDYAGAQREESVVSAPETAATAASNPARLKAPTEQAAIANTNTWNTKQLVTMALMCAIGAMLSFVEFPLVPAAPFLKYDASLVPAMVCGFAYGPAAGIAVGTIGAIIHGIMLADLTGCIMNILVVFGFILPAALVYKRSRTYKFAIAGLALGIAGALVMALIGNLTLTPLYMGVPLEAVVEMIIPILIPFNLVKGALNAVLTLVVYKSISNVITPKKHQVKGK